MESTFKPFTNKVSNTNPAFGVIVYFKDESYFTLLVPDGLILPPAPAVAVIANVFTLNLAKMVLFILTESNV